MPPTVAKARLHEIAHQPADSRPRRCCLRHRTGRRACDNISGRSNPWRVLWDSSCRNLYQPAGAPQIDLDTSSLTPAATSAHDCPRFCRRTRARGYHGLSGRSRNQYQMRAWPCGTITQVGTPERAGKMRGGVAHGHDGVAGGHQRGEAVDVVHVVDVGKALDHECRARAASGARSASVSPYCRSTKRIAGRAKQRCKVLKPRALRRAADRRLADPGQCRPPCGRRRAARARRRRAPRRRRDSRARGAGTPPSPAGSAGRGCRADLRIDAAAIERGRERDHRHAGERAREQAHEPRLDLEHDRRRCAPSGPGSCWNAGSRRPAPARSRPAACRRRGRRSSAAADSRAAPGPWRPAQRYLVERPALARSGQGRGRGGSCSTSAPAASGCCAISRSNVASASSKRSRSISTSPRTVSASTSSGSSASARSQLASASAGAAELAQHDGARGQRAAMVGIDGERRVELAKRLVRAAELIERVGAVASASACRGLSASARS